MNGDSLMKWWRLFLIIFSGAGFLVACGVTWQRIQWESDYKEVGVMLPLTQVALLAQQENISLETALEKFKDQNITTFSLDLWELADWQKTILQPPPWTSDKSSHSEILFPVETFRSLQNHGYNFAFLIQIDALPNAETLKAVLFELEKLQVRKIYFSGGSLANNPDVIEFLSNWLIRYDIQWGTVEFAEPKGAEKLFLAGATNFARAHQIKDEEMAELSHSNAIERWERAVVERNLRVLNVHLWPTTLEDNLSYLLSIQSRITKSGFSQGWPRPIEPLNTPNQKTILILLGLSFLSFVIWVISLRWSSLMSLKQTIPIWLILALATILFVTWKEKFSIQLFALIMANVFPICVYLPFREWVDHFKKGILRGLMLLVLASFGSLACGIFIAAVITRETYLLKLDEFQGVKIALIMPLVIILFFELTRSGWGEFRNFWLRPLRLIDCFLLSAGAAVFGVILLRSGNFSIVPIPDSEQEVRTFLENWLYARPRFKEFFLGHPLLFTWAALGGERLGFYAPFILVGAWVGQVSILNTFAHLHTPWVLSFWRTVNGIFAGLAIGVFIHLAIWGTLWAWGKWQSTKS